MKSIASVLLLQVITFAIASAQSLVTERINTGPCVPGSFSPTTATNTTATPTNGSDTGLSASASFTSSPYGPGPRFLLSYQVLPASPIRRRQQKDANTRFVTSTGRAVSDCLLADSYYIDINGRLTDKDGLTYSTFTYVDSSTFTLRQDMGDISTFWSLTNGTLTFANETFTHGKAAFCIEGTGGGTGGLIQSYYTSPPPPDCTPVDLTALPLSLCPDIGHTSIPHNYTAPTIFIAPPTGTAGGMHGQGPGKPATLNPTVAFSTTGVLPRPSNTTSTLTNSIPLNSSTANHIATGSTPCTSVTAVPDPPSGSTCGQDGLLEMYSRRQTPTSLEDCALFCLNSTASDCQSFHFDTQDMTCSTSPGPLGNSAFAGLQKSPLYNFDRACYAMACNSNTPLSPFANTTLPATDVPSMTGISTVGINMPIIGVSSIYSTIPTSNTVSPTSTSSTPTPHPTTSGLAYFAFDASTQDPSNPDITAFKTNPSPLLTGLVENLSFSTTFPDQTAPFPGNGNHTTSLVACIYQGYFLAPSSAIFTITINGYNGYLWSGGKAYKDWTVENADVNEVDSPSAFTFALQEGDVVPITIAWVSLTVPDFSGFNVAIGTIGGEVATTGNTTGFFGGPVGDEFTFHL